MNSFSFFVLLLQDGTTYFVGKESVGENRVSPPPPLTLNTGMVRRSSLSPRKAKGEMPKSPVLSFRKEVSGSTTFRIAEVNNDSS